MCSDRWYASALEPLQVYDAGEHFMMSPLGEDEGGRGVYKVVTAAEEGVKHSKPNKCVTCVSVSVNLYYCTC